MSVLDEDRSFLDKEFFITGLFKAFKCLFLSTGLHAAFTVTVENPSVKVKENEGKFHFLFSVYLPFSYSLIVSVAVIR